MRLIRASTAFAMFSVWLQAQTNSASEHIQFEAASVKLNTSGSDNERIRLLPGGRLEISNMTLRLLIQSAYRVTSFQIASGPGWLDSDRFDISAKPDADPGPAGVLVMLQSLLEQRFALAAHREVREERVYLLTLSKGSRKLEPAEGTCVPRDPARTPPNPEPGQSPPNYCGNIRRSRQSLEGDGIPVASLSGQLASILERAVIDKTGLPGLFNFRLRWTPETDLAQPGASPTSDPAAPSIFTALQEQLGLRLEFGRGPVEMLVIDRVEKPGAN